MSTIKSSDEHLTLNADGSSKDIKFQANGVEKASISSSGAFTSTTIDATALTGDLPAISGANLTGVGVSGITSSADATAITIDSRENVGIGVVPESDWYNGGVGSEYRMLQMGAGAVVGGYGDNSTYLGSNWKDDAANKYINTDEASLYKQQAGNHYFKVAPSGSADSALTFTNAMTITNDGRGLSQFTAKVWIRFNGVGTVAIKDSHNVSSITDYGTGDYLVSFSNGFANNLYSSQGTGGYNATSAILVNQPANMYVPATGSCRYRITDGGSSGDAQDVNILIFGD